ncbi:MAG: hypothetical protein A2W31_01075 [Planctomycetes bacterium RBG_16_64_10]|nr:MAG: hypothetical protein A2W31_01075 [Planctomycetes bacterium RBG_16_64_10]
MRYWPRNGGILLILGIVLGLAVGLHLGGVYLGAVWPNVPVHAVATDAGDNFAIATGPVDERVEAVYVLDFMTGDLRAAVLNNQLGRFLAVFNYNIVGDFGGAAIQNPKYLMVTGLADVPRGYGRQVQTMSVVYVAEVTSGQVAAYAIPWNQTFQSARKPQMGTFIALDKLNFRTALIRD